jgi:type IV pilus assembly protein PilW
MHTMKKHHHTRPAQRGLTLIELMVGLTLGLLVTAALLTVFANASNTGRNLERASQQIETGRYVAELMSEDLRLAGFYGEVQFTGTAYSQPDPCSSDPNPAGALNWVADPLTLPTPVRGYREADAVGCLTHRRPGTDAVAMRRVSVEITAPASLPGTNTQNYVQYSYCQTDPAMTRLVFGTASSGFVLHNRNCTAANGVRAYVSRLYFVDSCNQCGTGGDTIPTLKRMELIGNQVVETPLAEGVEMMRIEYGFDTNNDGAPDTYLLTTDAAVAGATWENVVSIKLHYVTRSIEKASGTGLATAQSFTLGGAGTYEIPTADGYTRRVYTTVVRLANPSGQREVQ